MLQMGSLPQLFLLAQLISVSQHHSWLGAGSSQQGNANQWNKHSSSKSEAWINEMSVVVLFWSVQWTMFLPSSWVHCADLEPRVAQDLWVPILGNWIFWRQLWTCYSIHGFSIFELCWSCYNRKKLSKKSSNDHESVVSSLWLLLILLLWISIIACGCGIGPCAHHQCGTYWTTDVIIAKHSAAAPQPVNLVQLSIHFHLGSFVRETVCVFSMFMKTSCCMTVLDVAVFSIPLVLSCCKS